MSFQADASLLYRANLELRTANRVLKRVAQFDARTWFELERHAKKIPWSSLLGAGMVPEFEVTSRKSKLYHNRGIAERLERLVGRGGQGADVDPSRVARFQVRAVRDHFTISADASGELLHRRGYRLETAKAPLRETLAAAMLLGCKWNGTIRAGGSLLRVGHHPDRGGAPGATDSAGAAAEFCVRVVARLRRDALGQGSG